ncbi:hypothetical protein QJU43_06655 [Pasteurella atlantica]|nr:hypothetical protein [Pasteurella atlantica]MDP8033839.1 hypothetical protein [Pasteurella atlantica]MDP8035774.1 hypothetical protein [Pasteurella atlantica]MDP8037691.1 hypothetical protein [Pasteurella atlantica]MDP8048075.1 hypothetical protein [Pasteurella atlantica]MDP8050098.1 hypothetical protein [Pasteurella atlantica]
MLDLNSDHKYISDWVLEAYNLSIEWRDEVNDFAMDLIYLTEEGFEMTDGEIREKLNKLEK